MQTLLSCPRCQTVVDALGYCPACEATVLPNETPKHLPVIAADQPVVITRDPAITVTNLAGQAALGSTVTQGERRFRSGDQLPAIAGYEILSKIGEGGGGIVYKARQLQAERIVAIKVLLGSSQRDRERFTREIRALASLKHPSVVEIYEVGQCDDGPYFSMEYLEGGSLSQALKQRLPEQRQAADWTRQIALGVQAAHEAKFLHRDLKPGNILLSATDEPKVADFGLAKIYYADPSDPTVEPMTVSGDFLGTPAYSSPEQCAGRISEMDARSDVYSIGATLYCMLTGRAPFPGGSVPVVTSRVMHCDPDRLTRSDEAIHPDLEAVCLKCLEKKSSDRYDSAAALAADLDRFLHGESTLARPMSRVHRTGKWVRKSARLLLSTILTSLLTLLAFLVIRTATMEDPDAELKKIRKEIQTGNTVNLTLPDGKPRWSRWESGVGQETTSKYNRHYTLQSVLTSYLQLLPAEDVPEEFELIANVLHEDSTNPNFSSQVGLYFGRFVEDVSEQQSFAYYMHLSVRDITVPMKEKLFPIEVGFETIVENHLMGRSPDRRHEPIRGNIYERKPFAIPVMRELHVISQKNNVLVRTNEPPSPNALGNVTVPIERLNGNFVKSLKLTDPTHPAPDFLSARGSLGLRIVSAQVSIQSVTIRKLLPEN